MHLPKAEVMSQLPRIIALLGAESNVVHSYAAHTIERILTIKDQQNGSTIHAKPMFSPRFTADDLLPLSQDLLRGLFGALGKPEGEEEEEEGEEERAFSPCSLHSCIYFLLTLFYFGR